MVSKLKMATTEVAARIDGDPKIALVLGSGLSKAFEKLDHGKRILWNKIPGFPLPTVLGHSGEFWSGQLNNTDVLIQRGRTHYYEGYSFDEITFSIRMMSMLGIKHLIITNASGAINPDFSAGDIVLITDHINMLGGNPLRGQNLDQFGPRFPDMSSAYSKRLREIAWQAARQEGIELREGVYVATLGPSYETPAEIQAFRALGADLVGMSTVPEVITAVHCGLEVLGVSCATNLAAGVDPQATLSHEEVIETTDRKAGEMHRLLSTIIPRILRDQ